MVKIIFKNVGQGDSILLEWKLDDKPKIAIIDCNLYQSTNPVLDHIIEFKIKEIEFIILSHPHTDHFSGFYELLEYCRKYNILIKRFLHTSQVVPLYLRSASRSLQADNELFKLFQFLKIMRDNKEIEIYTIDDNPNTIIPLCNNFYMEILSPSSIEIDNFTRGVSFPFDEENAQSNPNANWLSTVLKIYSNRSCAILTSDVESSVLTRIGKRKSGRIGVDKLVLGQIPHHGSKGNLNKSFWQMRKRNELTPVVISVGKNGYKHPSSDVITFFSKTSNYEIVRTDTPSVLPMNIAKMRQISSSLDIVSSNMSAKKYKNHNDEDKIFIFTNAGCSIV